MCSSDLVSLLVNVGFTEGFTVSFAIGLFQDLLPAVRTLFDL